MIEITVGMYDPQGGESLPFTGCFSRCSPQVRENKGYRKPLPKRLPIPTGETGTGMGLGNGLGNRYRNSNRNSNTNRMLGAGEKAAASEQPKMREVA